MTETHGKKSNARNKARSYPGFIQLFFKQVVASLAVGILFFLMGTIPSPVLNNCARALGDALRYEMGLPTEKLPAWLIERIPILQ